MNEEMQIYNKGSHISIKGSGRCYDNFAEDCIVLYNDNIMYMLTLGYGNHMRLWVHFIKHDRNYNERRLNRRFYNLGRYGEESNIWIKIPEYHKNIARKMVEYAQNTILTSSLLAGK